MATNIITSKTRAYRDVKPPVGSSVNWSHPLSKGLVGCWLMNEGGGLSVRNLASYKFNGSIVGATWKGAKSGIGLDFSSDYVNCGKFNITTNNYTLVANVKQNSSGTNQVIVGRSGMAGENPTFYFRTNGTAGSNTSGGYKEVTIPTLTTNKWEHMVLVFNNKSTLNYFRNGIAGASPVSVTGTTLDNAGTYDTRIGSYGEIAGQYFSGMIEYVFIYNRPLSPSEIKSLYEAPYQMVAPARKIRYITPGVGGVTPPATQDATVTPSAIVSRFFAPAVSVTATSGSESATVTATAIKASFVAPAVTISATKNATAIATAIQVSVIAPSVTVSTGGNATITATAIKTSFVANTVTIEATKNAIAVATAAAVRFLANSVTISATTSATVSVTSVSIKFVAGVATVQAIRNVTIDATSAYAQFLVNSATIVIGGVDSGITEVILLSSLVSKRLHEKSRISKRLNEVSRIDKTLLLDSPIH